MKLPDLHALEEAGVHASAAGHDAVAAAARGAHLAFREADLSAVTSKATLLDAVAKGLAFPAHFGHNWDALADCLEDEDIVGRKGIVVRLSHAAAYRKAHAADWQTFTDILDEAADYWRERHLPFWVFVA